MAVKKLPPVMGIDNKNADDALEIGGKSPALFVREALNVDISAKGTVTLRDAFIPCSAQRYKDLWQSPLHGDVFARLQNSWVKVNPIDWSHEVLIEHAGDGPFEHIVANNFVMMGCAEGIYTFNGRGAKALCIPSPATPNISAQQGGSLSAGIYSVAVSWVVDGVESGLSALAQVECQQNSQLDLIFPYCIDHRIQYLRLYLTEANGNELRLAGEYPVSQIDLQITTLPNLGKHAEFQFLTPMKSGRYLRLWKSRILVANLNCLYFSKTYAFHLTDERYDFIQLPQRITFVEPVDGGLWVGQYDHVVFLRGTELKNLSIERKKTGKPVAGSSFTLPASSSSSLNQAGAHAAVWLSDIGFTAGLSTGELVHLQDNHLIGLDAKSACCVGFADRVIATVH